MSIKHTCSICGTTFRRKPSKGGVYCSLGCTGVAKSRKHAADDHATRFWDKVEKGKTCWTWRAARDLNGYGRFCAAGIRFKAHRYSYVLINGPIPDGMDICHQCDNPPCVRPSHLFLGTRAVNMADMIAKGRSTLGRPAVTVLYGEARGSVKITEALVREIRATYAAGGVSQSQLAKQLGVGQTLISDVVRRKAWAHVA